MLALLLAAAALVAAAAPDALALQMDPANTAPPNAPSAQAGAPNASPPKTPSPQNPPPNAPPPQAPAPSPPPSSPPSSPPEGSPDPAEPGGPDPVPREIRLPPRPGPAPDDPPHAARAARPGDFVPREIVVGLTEEAPEEAGASLATAFGLERRGRARLETLDLRVLRLHVPDARNVAVLLEVLRADPRVTLAQRSRRFRLAAAAAPAEASAAPPPAGAGEGGALAAAHRVATGRGVLVAMVDGGVDAAHPALAGRVAEQVDLVGGDAAGARAHGTATASVLVGRGELRGAAPDARLLVLRAFGRDPEAPEGGRSSTWLVARAVDRAVRRGAAVLNLSFAGPPDPLVARVVGAAREEGALVVAAAGNGGPDAEPPHPGAVPGVLAVTAVDARGRLYAHATRGPHVAVAAPGVEVLTAAPGGAYALRSGTSLAAARVSGLAALLLERRPELGADALRERLRATARDLGPPGPDPAFGAGLVDAPAALAGLGEPQKSRASRAAGAAGRGAAERD